MIANKTIKVDEETYQDLDKIRSTDRGKVSFDQVIRFLIKEYKK